MPELTDTKVSISVALIDGHGVLRDSLEHLLDSVPGMSVLACYATPNQLVTCLHAFEVDVVVTDILFGGCDALREIGEWTREYPDTRVLVLSHHPEEVYAERALAAGASGYITKDRSAEDLRAAIAQVARGEVVLSTVMANRLLAGYSRHRQQAPLEALDRLSDRELLVFTLIGQGYTTAKIAEDMGISKKTVSTFKERIKVKLALDNSLQLAQFALQSFGRAV